MPTAPQSQRHDTAGSPTPEHKPAGERAAPPLPEWIRQFDMFPRLGGLIDDPAEEHVMEPPVPLAG
jgi:hypothetical protein